MLAVLSLSVAGLVAVFPVTEASAASAPRMSVVVSGSSLAGLTLSPLTLTPAFSPSIHDYVVRCQAGTTSATLALTASGTGSITVAGVAGHSISFPTALVENEAVVVQAPDPQAPTGPPVEYWVRCLPHDFPALKVVDSGSAPPGWYLTGNITASTQGAASGIYAMVLDQHGTPVWYQPAPFGAINTELLPGHTIAWAPAMGPGFGTDPNGAYTLRHLDTQTTTSQSAPVPPMDPHELLQLPNGHRLFIASPLRSGFDLSSLGPTFSGINTIVDCVAEEVDASGALVWQWRMSDHVGISEAATTPMLGAPATVNGQSVADLFHCNSLEVDPNGNVLVSSRNTNALYLVNKTTGNIMWKLGGTPTNHDNATILHIQNDPETAFSGQHDARFRPNGDVTLYDDHTGASGAARGVEYAISPTAGTASLVWQYADAEGRNSGATGSFRRSADGTDNIVGWGFRTGSGFTETNASGTPLLDVTYPNGELEYRAVKADPSSISAEELHQTSAAPVGGSWEALGGTLSSSPVVASWAPSRLDVFARGTDNTLQHKWYAGAWSGWESLGGALTSAPAVASWGPGRLDVFARGPDNTLYHKYFNGTWSGWESLGGALSSAPAVASWASGRLDVFVRGTDNALYHKYFNGTWSGWENLGGGLSSSPAVATSASRHLDVFVRGAGNAVYQRSFNGTQWGAWTNRGGSLASAPAATSSAAGRLDLFGIGTDGLVWERTSSSKTWSATTSMGVATSIGLGVDSWGKNRLDLFTLNLDGTLGHRWGDHDLWSP